VRSIVLANQKGGVGKTTTAIHLAHGFAPAGRRVALLDLDPQGNATVAVQAMTWQGSEANDPFDSGPLESLTRLGERLWLLPSSGTGAALARSAAIDVDRLQGLLDELGTQIEVLVIDCPPRMDEWGWAGLRFAEQVVVPVQTEFFAMHGLSQMLAALDVASAEFPGRSKLRGVLPTMVDCREAVAMEVLEDLRRNLGARMLDSVILRDASLVEAASFGKTVFEHCPFSKSALCYSGLVKELIDG
jgi:chromosome partitioning protein